MSTRSSTHFHNADGSLEAIVFRHTDGYPSGAGADLLRFVKETGALNDSRHDDASLLAARYVVFLARKFANSNPLDFLSVRVMMEDSQDIEYRYHVYCGNPARVTVEKTNGPETTIQEAMRREGVA